MTQTNDYITNDYKPLQSSVNIAAAQDFFAEVSYSHFPVVEDGIYVGSVSAEDVETFETDKTLAEFRYSFEGFFARTNMIWLDVLEVFARYHTNVVPVLNEQNEYVGYYEIEDIVRFFHETPFLKEQGGIIVVQKPVLDYTMSEVAQIVETNHGHILGCFLSNVTADSVEITIKISIGAMNEIIQTFRRYNYEIMSEHQDDNYINSLKERSDYLDKYLSI